MWPWCFLVYCLFVRSLTLRASDLVGGLCPVAVSSVTLQLSFLYFFKYTSDKFSTAGEEEGWEAIL